MSSERPLDPRKNLFGMPVQNLPPNQPTRKPPAIAHETRRTSTKAQEKRLLSLHPARRAMEASFLALGNHPPVGTAKLKAKSIKETQKGKKNEPKRAPVKATVDKKIPPKTVTEYESGKPMLIYCVGCKEKTQSESVKVCQTKNKRRMIRAVCSQCNRRKAQFIQ